MSKVSEITCRNFDSQIVNALTKEKEKKMNESWFTVNKTSTIFWAFTQEAMFSKFFFIKTEKNLFALELNFILGGSS